MNRTMYACGCWEFILGAPLTAFLSYTDYYPNICLSISERYYLLVCSSVTFLGFYFLI